MVYSENEEFHLKIKKGDVGRYVILPGDLGRYAVEAVRILIEADRA